MKRLVWSLIALSIVICLFGFAPKHSKAKPSKPIRPSTGISVWIYILEKAEGGDPSRIVKKAKTNSLSGIIVCTDRFGRTFGSQTKIDRIQKLCGKNGIEFIPYQRCSGANPDAEANRAINRLKKGANVYVFDIEGEYKVKEGPERLIRTLGIVRAWRDKHKKGAKIYYSSFGLRSRHANFPWEIADSLCDGNMPQWYMASWHKSQGWSKDESIKQILLDLAQSNYKPPTMPVLQAYGRGKAGAYSSPQDLEEELKAIRSPEGISIFRWELMDEGHWKIIRKFTKKV